MAKAVLSTRSKEGRKERMNGVPTTFKRLGVDDFPTLQNVAEDVFDDVIDFHFAKNFLQEARNILIVALDGDRVVAQIVAVVHQHVDAPCDLFIENLGVAPDWRRRGVARRLIALAFEAGAELGAKTAWVGTEADNDPANALYRSTGANAGRFVMHSYNDLKNPSDTSTR